MSLKQRLDEDVKAAMRARDRERLGTLRLITAAIKQREVDERIVLDDAQVLAVIDKMVKQRRESIATPPAALIFLTRNASSSPSCRNSCRRRSATRKSNNSSPTPSPPAARSPRATWAP